MLLIVEIKGYQYSGAFILDSQYCHQEENKSRIYAFCIYSESVIKIFDLQFGHGDEYSWLMIDEMYKEVNLKWWQKIIRFISFGNLYSNKSHLYATIYNKDKLNFLQKAISRISFGYFYPTTAKIMVDHFGLCSTMYKYSCLNGKPVLWKFKQDLGQSADQWVKCADLPEISPAIEAKEPVRLDDQENTEEPIANKDITHKKRFLTWGDSNEQKLNQNVPIPLCVQQNVLNSDKLDINKKID